MNATQTNDQETQRALLGKLIDAEVALCANLNLKYANVTARVHMQRALAHIQEASIAVTGVRRARTVWQLVEDLTRVKRDTDDPRIEPPVRLVLRPI